jgi:hypothetical protein
MELSGNSERILLVPETEKQIFFIQRQDVNLRDDFELT